MIYIVNVWNDANSIGTGCLYRTNRKADFLKKAKELFEFYGVTNYRLVIHAGITVLSFPENMVSYYTWINQEFTRKPVFCEYRNFKQAHKIYYPHPM